MLERPPSEPPPEARIGVFDSGVGGLTVVAAVRTLMPALPVEYIADTAFFPYGDRTDDEVAARSEVLTGRLVARGCVLVVVACNTASSASLERLRERFGVPIVGMEPPLKPAAERSRSGRVVVLATPATARGERLQRLRRLHGGDAVVETVPMPGLAALVESGNVDGAAVEAALRDALRAPVSEGADEVALGCTHYGFLRPLLERLLPSSVEVLDAAEPVARRVRQVLEQRGLLTESAAGPRPVHCTVTGDRAAFAAAVESLRRAGASLPSLDITAASPPEAAAATQG